MQDSIIEVRDLTVEYHDRMILNHLSFSIQKGKVCVILGGSGSGKTTLLNHLIGLRRPKSGEIFIAGKNIAQAIGQEREAILKSFGVMFQGGALFGSMTLLENVMLPMEACSQLPPASWKPIALTKLRLVGLGNFAHYFPAELSGGMQKRAAIARSMALDPSILFLDEPSAGLDPISSANLDALILNLSKTLGITFIVVTHELPSVETIADQVIMLYEGKIIAEGTPQELKQQTDHPFVHQFFNRRVTQHD